MTKGMNALELLRFNWKPSVIRLGLAAWVDAGPVSRRAWVLRTGLPANHFAAALGEAQRLGLLKVETPAEGLRLLVQPVVFWQERPIAGAEEFLRAWGALDVVAVQGRMALGTEMPSLAEALAENDREGASRIPGVAAAEPPDSGGAAYRIPVVPVNVHRLPPSEKILEALNGERLTAGAGFREGEGNSGLNGVSPHQQGRTGWIEPETEQEALAACRQLLGGEAEMRLWGGLWRKRWRANPEGLRKILNMVREDQANGRLPRSGSNWGRYAGDLWKRFVVPNEKGQA